MQKFGVETFLIQKLLVNFTINTELNVKMLSRRTETVFSFKTEIIFTGYKKSISIRSEFLKDHMTKQI